MPTIAWFNGIAIRMFFNDHAPPHFHAYYGRHEAKFDIATGYPIGGTFPSPQRKLVQRWILRYRPELMVAWDKIGSDETPERIPALSKSDGQ